jgi:hypothetical protein
MTDRRDPQDGSPHPSIDEAQRLSAKRGQTRQAPTNEGIETSTPSASAQAISQHVGDSMDIEVDPSSNQSHLSDRY